MSNRDSFIQIIQTEIFDNNDDKLLDKYPEKVWVEALNFWEDFLQKEDKQQFTENGKKILIWMQETREKMNNLFTSKEIAEALFTSGRSVAGSMRKLVTEGYVEKVGQNPIQYALTDKGMNAIFV